MKLFCHQSMLAVCALGLLMGFYQQVLAEPKHILFAFVDHFEPCRPDIPECDYWVTDYMNMASKHVDADGRHPSHSYFMYWAGNEPFMYGFDIHKSMSKINEAVYKGYGETEYHLHHGVANENSRSEQDATIEFINFTNHAKSIHNSYGSLITAEERPRQMFGYIHGMWALDNSRIMYNWPLNQYVHQYCGVNQELLLLRELGCYADFTFTSPYPMNPFIGHSIFYVKDDPNPASYQNWANISFVQANKPPAGDLMIIEGPDPAWPDYDDGDIGIFSGHYYLPATLTRMNTWVAQNIHVPGREDWIFVKVFTHGCYDLDNPQARDAFFGVMADQFYNDIDTQYNDGSNFVLHYVSAREMYNMIKAAEAGLGGNPNQYRDYAIKPYVNTKIYSKVRYNTLTYSPHHTVLKLVSLSKPADFSLKEFNQQTHIEESTDNINWSTSDSSRTTGFFGELRFTDATPSLYYRITDGNALLADFNANQTVDLGDLSCLTSQWLNIACSPDNNWCNQADIDQSGTVDVQDMFILMREWLWLAQPNP